MKKERKNFNQFSFEKNRQLEKTTQNFENTSKMSYNEFWMGFMLVIGWHVSECGSSIARYRQNCWRFWAIFELRWEEDIMKMQ